MKKFLILAATLLMVSGCQKVEQAEPESIELFDEVTVHFTPDDPEKYDSPFASARDNGRIMATYQEMPAAGGPRTAVLRLEVEPIRKDIRNVVDRWDRAGWVRLVKPGMAPVELCRFMTAYGGEIEHTVDISHLAPLLEGHCEFEVFIDTWVSPAWVVDVELEIAPAPFGLSEAPDWAMGVLFPEGGLNAEKPAVSSVVTVPAGTRRVQVAAITTGHCTDGRDADEFITKDNVLLVDGVEVYRWRPWRDDCGEFRAVNPYCAKWSDGSWSSDYSRSGWCPGDVALPEMIDLSDLLTPGEHTLTWMVEDIRAADPADSENHHGYWRVSASVIGWK